MGLFDFLRKKTTSKTKGRVVNNNFVYDTIIRENSRHCCYCNKWENVRSDIAKVLESYPEVQQDDVDEILDGVSFIINEIPNDFPINIMKIVLDNRYSIRLEDTLNQNYLSQTCPENGVRYELYISTQGIGWGIYTYDSWGESHHYKSSNLLYWTEMIEFSIDNVYGFINSLLTAMGYWSIRIPENKRNLVKPSYIETHLKSPEEEYQIGCQFYKGKGQKIDWGKAYLHFRNSAKRGFGKGMYYYACCLLEGKGVKKNIIKGRVWLEKACEEGVSLAYERMGQAFSVYVAEFGHNEEASKEAYHTAFRLFEVEAENNDHEALYHLALCYFYGHGVEKNKQKAIELLNKAIDKGNDEACFEMALCYTTGDGVERDVFESFSWYQKAASLGNVEAYYILGWCYETGTGTLKDFTKAFEWYMKGAQQNHGGSQYKVGLCFMQGIGTEKDLDAASVFLNLASQKGIKTASLLVRQIIIE